MTTALHKFPSTPHLADLGGTGLRADKILTSPEVERFLGQPVLVEEKIDGANLGLSFDPDGKLRFQNRGAFLEPPYRGQWSNLRDWAAARKTSFENHLPGNCVLFGEWCHAEHSIAYDRLPDWFIGFDVFDREKEAFWSHDRRNSLLAALGLPHAPRLAEGTHSLDDLRSLLSQTSHWSYAPIEGLYLRREADGWLEDRAKLVRPDFTQNISEHWSRRPIRRNRVAYGLRAPAQNGS